MIPSTIIPQTIEFVKATLAYAEGGHDWWHVYRVWQLSKRIAETEQADLLVVELGALLHDIADSKFHEGDEEAGPRKAREFLTGIGVEESVILPIFHSKEETRLKRSSPQSWILCRMPTGLTQWAPSALPERLTTVDLRTGKCTIQA